MNLFSSLCNHLDIFRFFLTLSYKNKEDTTTIIGKMMSLLILSFIIYSIKSSDCFNKSNPQTLGQEFIRVPRPSFIFSKENFTFAIGVADADNNFSYDETIFKIRASLYHRDNKKLETKKIDIKMRPCTQDDFKEDPSEFTNFGLNGTLCFPLDEIFLSGYWDNDWIDYFWFELITCKNSSESKVICQSPEIIEKFFMGSYLDVYLTRNSIDPNNYESPFSRSLAIYYKSLDVKTIKTMTIHMIQVVMQTEDGVLLESKNNIMSYLIGEIEYDFAFKKEEQEILFGFSLYSSSSQNFISRKYQNLQSLLSDIFGITK